MIGALYEFLYADIGLNVCTLDGGILTNCSWREAMEINNITIPDPAPLPHHTKDMLFVCTGDDASSLSKYTMKP